MNLIINYQNIYVNNHKFLLIVSNIVLQLSPGLIDYSHENLLKIDGL